MKTIHSIFLSFGLLAVGVSLAEAHAFIEDAQPAVGCTLQDSPDVVKIWFTSHLKPGPSTIQVFDNRDREVDKRDIRVDVGDPTLLTVSVPRLVPGTYKVTWTAVCIDNHTTHGTFNFTVAAK